MYLKLYIENPLIVPTTGLDFETIGINLQQYAKKKKCMELLCYRILSAVFSVAWVAS